MARPANDGGAADRPSVRILDDVGELAAVAADAFRETIASAPQPRIAVCLSGGSTPLHLYERLLAAGARAWLPWDRVHWFWGDERMVPMTDGRSNAGTAWRTLLAEGPAPAGNVHPIPVSGLEPDEAAARYAAELQAFYGASTLDSTRPLFDLMLLGLGSDGHTASLFPGSAALAERERWVVGVAHAGLAPFVSRVTLTLPALASARETLFLVSGADKREALAGVLAGADRPASRVRSCGRLRWLVDRAAAGADAI